MKIEYFGKEYEYDYDPLKRRVNVWDPSGEWIISYHDTECQWGDPDYGTEEEQVFDLIDGYYENMMFMKKVTRCDCIGTENASESRRGR